MLIKGQAVLWGEIMGNKNLRIDKRIKYGKLKIYFCILIFLAVLVFIIIFKTDFFLVKNIIVLDNYKISTEEVIAYSNIDSNDNIFKLKASDIEEKIEKNPYIKDVKLERDLPDKIIIDIEERKELASISNMDIYFVIDSEGYILKTVTTPPDTYIVKGFEFDSFVEGEKINVNNEDLNKALELCRLFQVSEIDLKPNIVYNDNNFEMLFKDNIKVKFGDGEEIEDKFNDFVAIFKDLQKKNIKSGLIDVSSKGYSIYRPFGE